MNQEQMIDYMKNGEWSEVHQIKVYVSFGQWLPEMQELARKIGKKSFVILMEYGWITPINPEFRSDFIYRLRSDYELPKPEPELEYYEIHAGDPRYYIVLRENVHPPVSDVHGFVRFAGFSKTCDQRDNFQQNFTPDMKYVVLRKDKP